MYLIQLCILKWKIWTAILAIGASIAIAVGPLITGNYLFNLLSPIELAPFVCAIRLAKPVSWWAKWFYWGPMGSDRRLLRPETLRPDFPFKQLLVVLGVLGLLLLLAETVANVSPSVG